MRTDKQRLQQLAALSALGALDAEEAQTLAQLLGTQPDAARETKAFAQVVERLAETLPKKNPPSHLKQKILDRIEASETQRRAEAALQHLLPKAHDGLAFLPEAAANNWISLPVPGASFKILSYDPSSQYAVVLGKLDPGSRYPGHAHRQAEDIFMLSGDLHVGNETIRAGDFHHAEAGSRHPVNWSEAGCVLICVLSKEDLLAQLRETH